MSRGLYRVTVTESDIVRISWGRIEGRPYISRAEYEEQGCEPPFDELPSHREYLDAL